MSPSQCARFKEIWFYVLVFEETFIWNPLVWYNFFFTIRRISPSYLTSVNGDVGRPFDFELGPKINFLGARFSTRSKFWFFPALPWKSYYWIRYCHIELDYIIEADKLSRIHIEHFLIQSFTRKTPFFFETFNSYL